MTDKRPHISADPHVLAAGLYRVFVGISPSTYTSWPARCPVPSICRHIAADPHVLARPLAATEHLSVYRRCPARPGPTAGRHRAFVGISPLPRTSCPARPGPTADRYRAFVGISPLTRTSWPACWPVPSICRYIAADPHVLARPLTGTEHLSAYRRCPARPSLPAGRYRGFVGISPCSPGRTSGEHGTEDLSAYRRVAQAGPLASTAPRICRHIAVQPWWNRRPTRHRGSVGISPRVPGETAGQHGTEDLSAYRRETLVEPQASPAPRICRHITTHPR